MSYFQPMDNAVNIMCDMVNPNGFDTTDNADDVDGADKVDRILRETGRIKVWTGFSDGTIYAKPSVNYRARAWHDRCHSLGTYPHDHTGESATLAIQTAMVKGLRLYESVRIIRLLESEVIGQVELFYRTGAFADNQREFTAWYEGRHNG